MATLTDSNINVDKLTYEIFSILENKFLFGYEDADKHSNHNIAFSDTPHSNSPRTVGGKIRVLSIDGGGTTDGVLAATSLACLEASLRRKSANPDARIADHFDVVAGTGVGGVLAALLFSRGKDGSPLFTAEEALAFLLDNRRRLRAASPSGMLRRVFRPARKADRLFGNVFGELTLKDTMKPLLIPCYDLTTGAPFVFSRADALEADGYDFKMRDVCVATSADPSGGGPIEIRSIDGRTRISAVGGGLAMNNPTAAAITHVLNNKLEFPLCKGVEDLLVLSLGNGESCSVSGNLTSVPAAFIKIAGDGASDMVDQAVSMAFGEWRTSNYVRIQANGRRKKTTATIRTTRGTSESTRREMMMSVAEEMLGEKNVESTLFRGRKLGEKTNLEKVENVCSDLIKEGERRKTCIVPIVALRQVGMPSPSRTSSSTTLSTMSSN